MDLLQAIIEPLTYPFMVRALLAAIMVGVLCPVVGAYMVLKGLSFFGDALAHAILPGVVITFLIGWPLAVGALASALLAALLIGVISQRGTLQEDTAIGIVFAGAFALGVALLSTTSSFAVDLTHILFGDVLGVSQSDLWVILALGLVVLGVVALFYKEFLVLIFDPVLALVLRLPATALRYLLLGLIALTVVTSLQTVGIALVLAMLVTPAATARILTRRLPAMMWWLLYWASSPMSSACTSAIISISLPARRWCWWRRCFLGWSFSLHQGAASSGGQCGWRGCRCERLSHHAHSR
jgi:manganese/iron transport system permease protein